ncbi:MAG: ABC transporter substrate-binding protein [Desulfobacterales bacterium]|nr:ABC transporter substrate-binding protein [Desulfobacterales bacterium]
MKRVKLLSLILAICFSMVQGVIAAETIPIGVPIPMTGWAAGSGADYFNGIKMSVDEINEAGGLLGKQIEIIRFDSKGFEPEVVMQAANYLCGQKKVAAVHAGWAGWGQDVRAYGKYDAPFFADDGSIDAVNVFREDPEKYSNIFQLTPTAEGQAESVFRALTTLPYEWPNKKIVIINTDDSWGLGISDTLIKNYEKIGWKIAKRETVPYGTTEWGVILSQIRRIKPALIHFEIASGQENISFFQQFLKRPTNSIVSLGWGITPREVVNVLGTKADGLVGQMPSGLAGPKAPNAEGQAWLDKWHKLYGYQVPAGAFITYTAVKAWANAVTKVGDAYDFKAVNTYLKENGYKGILGQLEWDKDNVLQLQKGSPVVHYQVQGGELQAIYTDPSMEPYPGSEFIKPRWIK